MNLVDPASITVRDHAQHLVGAPTSTVWHTMFERRGETALRPFVSLRLLSVLRRPFGTHQSRRRADDARHEQQHDGARRQHRSPIAPHKLPQPVALRLRASRNLRVVS